MAAEKKYDAENDRRKNRRYGIRESSLRFTKGGIFQALFQPPSKKYLVLNISESGLHFISRQELAEGSKITLSIEARLVDSAIKTTGVVVWCKKSTEHDAWRVGVKFSGMNKAAQQKLQHLLNNAIMDKVDVNTTIYFRESEKL